MDMLKDIYICYTLSCIALGICDAAFSYFPLSFDHFPHYFLLSHL